MQQNDLLYKSLVIKLAPLLSKGRNESATFLNWFLENIYRLDSVKADDSICDSQNDKGIGGIYIDDNLGEIHYFQSKIRQRATGTIGDTNLKTFLSSVEQFSTPEKIDAILNSNASEYLKNLIKRSNIRELVKNNYSAVSIYASN